MIAQFIYGWRLFFPTPSLISSSKVSGGGGGGVTRNIEKTRYGLSQIINWTHMQKTVTHTHTNAGGMAEPVRPLLEQLFGHQCVFTPED